MTMAEITSDSKRSASIRFALTVLLALFCIYVDVIYLGAPFIALLICPLISLVLVVSLLVQKAGIKNVLLSLVMGPPAVFLLVIVATLGLGELHNQWVLREVRVWGNELRQQRSSTGAFPATQKRFFHGNRAVFINEEYGASFISIDLFGQTRQSYSVESDQFLERKGI